MKTVAYIVISTMLGIAFSSCNQVLPNIDNREEFEDSISYQITDQSTLKGPLVTYIGSFLRSADPQMIDFDAYNFKETETRIDTSKGEKTYAVPSFKDKERYLVFMQIGNDICSFIQLKIRQDSLAGVYEVTAKDELNNILFKGNVRTLESTFSLTYISPDINTNLRASINHWGCSLSVWAAGTVVSTSIGLVNPIAGIAVALGYHILGEWACGKVK